MNDTDREQSNKQINEERSYVIPKEEDINTEKLAGSNSVVNENKKVEKQEHVKEPMDLLYKVRYSNDYVNIY